MRHFFLAHQTATRPPAAYGRKTRHRLRLIILTFLSAALYAACSPEGNNEKGVPAKELYDNQVHVELRSISDIDLNEEPKLIPMVSFVHSDGVKTGLEAFLGQVVVLNFWATWCGPCREEMPSLERLQKQFVGRDVQVIALSSDRKGAKVVMPFWRELNLTSIQPFYDPKAAVSTAMGVEGYPTTVLIDRQGLEVGRLVGPADWSSPEARELVLRILAQ